MLALAAIEARIASSPEWKYVPSPRLANTCLSLVKCIWPVHATPSPPIWLKVSVLRSIHKVM
ncbi:hypothetical protein D9M70_489460 [compost metagenome]